MKKVILIGDSIRMSYDKYVKEALADVAEVYYPEENCRFAEYVLRYAHEWKSKLKWPSDIDLVHWNAGLWDVLELYNDGPMTPIEFYEDTVARIDRRFRLLFPDAKIVFATTTPVLDHKYQIFSKAKRSNAVIRQYNEAALRALSGTGTIINDLYETVAAFPEEYFPDPVHPERKPGIEGMGNKVLSVICGELGINATDVNVENFTPEEYSRDNIGY